jgi:hypothetical protein
MTRPQKKQSKYENRQNDTAPTLDAQDSVKLSTNLHFKIITDISIKQFLSKVNKLFYHFKSKAF